MKIKKMLLLAGMAVAAIAFAAPAAAQAEVKLTRAAGGDLVKGDLVTATSKNLITTVAGGAILECTHVKLNYKVDVNGKDHVVLKPTTTHNAVATDCVTNAHAFGLGTPTNFITEAGAKDLTINTWGTGVADATFTSNTPAFESHCSYTGKIPVQATDTTDTLHVETGNKLTAPGCGDGEMHGTFTITTPEEENPEAKEPVIIHFEKTS